MIESLRTFTRETSNESIVSKASINEEDDDVNVSNEDNDEW